MPMVPLKVLLALWILSAAQEDFADQLYYNA